MNQEKLVFSRSLNCPIMDKFEYLERRVRYFRSFDINISHANITMMDFGMNVFEFKQDKTPEITERIRKYLYKRRGNYNNNKAI